MRRIQAAISGLTCAWSPLRLSHLLASNTASTFILKLVLVQTAFCPCPNGSPSGPAAAASTSNPTTLGSSPRCASALVLSIAARQQSIRQAFGCGSDGHRVGAPPGAVLRRALLAARSVRSRTSRSRSCSAACRPSTTHVGCGGDFPQATRRRPTRPFRAGARSGRVRA